MTRLLMVTSKYHSGNLTIVDILSKLLGYLGYL